MAERLTKPSLRDQSLAVIRQGMVSGDIHAGEIYSAAALATELGISNSPVREAMLTLVNQGLMEIVRNRGFRVIDLTEKQLDDIYELRVMLEVPAVAGLASSIVAVDEPTLRSLASDALSAAEREAIPEFLEADRTFHLTLLRSNGNGELVSIVESLRDRSRLYGIKALASTGGLAGSAREHVDILDAIFARDPGRTEELMIKHLRHIRQDWGSAHGGAGAS